MINKVHGRFIFILLCIQIKLCYTVKIHTELNNFHANNPVVSIGVFDGVHRGHKAIINRLKAKAQEINGESVVVTLWPHPRLVLKKDIDNLHLLNTLEEKKLLLEKQQIDHLVIIPFNQETSELTALEFIEHILVNKISVRYLLIGYDHHFGKGGKGDFQDLKKYSRQYNFQVERFEAKTAGDGTRISSTLIRNSLFEGNIQEANQYLGYNYFMIGRVVGGRHIGKEIGFPTANIEPIETYKMIPRKGVYAVQITLEGRKLDGMLNIGYRPTISVHGYEKSIEAHIFDFDENIYNMKIIIHLLERIRDEKKFDAVDALVNQLHKDKTRVQKILSGKTSTDW
mgnify:CR=1 FL=1